MFFFNNKDDEYVPNDNDYDDYDETQDYEESPSEPVEEDMAITVYGFVKPIGA